MVKILTWWFEQFLLLYNFSLKYFCLVCFLSELKRFFPNKFKRTFYHKQRRMKPQSFPFKWDKIDMSTTATTYHASCKHQDTSHDIEARNGDPIPHPQEGKGVKCLGYMYALRVGGECWSFDLTATLAVCIRKFGPPREPIRMLLSAWTSSAI